MGESHIYRKPRCGYPISAGNLDGGYPMSAGNLDGGKSHTYRKPDVGSHICRKPGVDPISAGNLDGGIPYLQET